MTKDKILKILDANVDARASFVGNIRHSCKIYNSDLGGISAQYDVLHQNIISASILKHIEAISLPDDFIKEIRDAFFGDSEKVPSFFSEIETIEFTPNFKHLSFLYSGVKFEGHINE